MKVRPVDLTGTVSVWLPSTARLKQCHVCEGRCSAHLVQIYARGLALLIFSFCLNGAVNPGFNDAQIYTGMTSTTSVLVITNEGAILVSA
jgi:hypothetical protein